MNLTGEDKTYILKEHMRNIYGISDKNYQRRVWIRAEGDEVDDYDETVNNFFDRGDWILENYEAFGISRDQYKILKDFRDAFDAFKRKRNPYLSKDFIDTPEWDRIVKMAGEVLDAFNYRRP